MNKGGRTVADQNVVPQVQSNRLSIHVNSRTELAVLHSLIRLLRLVQQLAAICRLDFLLNLE